MVKDFEQVSEEEPTIAEAPSIETSEDVTLDKIYLLLAELNQSINKFEKSNTKVSKEIKNVVSTAEKAVRSAEQVTEFVTNHKYAKQDAINEGVALAVEQIAEQTYESISEVGKRGKQQVEILERDSRIRRDRYTRAANRDKRYDRINTVILLILAAMLVWKLFL